MRLVIAEKKLTAEAIAKSIFKEYKYSNRTFISESSDIKITHCSGHIITFKEPHEYDENLKKWNIDTLPFKFPNPEYNIIPDKKELLENIKVLSKKADLVYHAGDPDDEGQLIVDEVLKYIKYDGQVKRVLFSDNNPVIIKKAFQEASSNENHKYDGMKALARSLCDWHYGLNLTRAYTCLNQRKGLNLGTVSHGRVQDAIKGLVIRRCEAIKEFKPVDFFSLHTQITLNNNKVLKPKLLNNQSKGLDGLLDEANRIISIKENKIINYFRENPLLKIINISDENKEQKPPLPYNLLKLQIDMNRKYGLSLDETLSITQSLRDKYNAITYNRSDCQYLSDETYSDSKEILEKIRENASIFSKKIEKTDLNIKSKCFNSKKVSAHHAIIPTFDNFDIDLLSENEKRCYFLIARSFIAQFYKNKKYSIKQITYSSQNGEYIFSTSLKNIIDEGWEELYRNDKGNDEVDDSDDIPEVSVKFQIGDTVTIDIDEEKLFFEKKQTSPPNYYKENSLALELTNVSKYISDPQLRKVMIDKDKGVEGEHGGIGTPATRGEILKNLFESGFLEKKGKNIIATEKCYISYNSLPYLMQYPDLTAVWQDQMNSVKRHEDIDKFLDNVMNSITTLIDKAKNEYYSIKIVEYDCPSCNSKLRKGTDKITSASVWFCSSYKDGCKYRCSDTNNKPSFEQILNRPKSNGRKKSGKFSHF